MGAQDALLRSPIDDGMTALQLPFLQSDEISRFLSPSKEWSLAPNDQDAGFLEYVYLEVDVGYRSTHTHTHTHTHTRTHGIGSMGWNCQRRLGDGVVLGMVFFLEGLPSYGGS
jgi:hypothetical protein